MCFLPPSLDIFVASKATDLRKSFDGLSVLVTSAMAKDPLGGGLFVFYNRRHNQARVLFWDGTGYCIFGKKLARGTFRFAEAAGSAMTAVRIDAAELALILEGIDLRAARRRVR